jgi:hypothetical protein
VVRRHKYRHLIRPTIEYTVIRVEKFNYAYFDINEWFENLYDRMDCYYSVGCAHLIEETSEEYSEVMRSIQTTSAIIFFLLLQIPLCRIHIGFSFATALIPMMLNVRTKYWFYQKANDFVVLIYKNDPEARNQIKRSKDLKYQNEEIEIDFDRQE